jgi:hypothetical protein
LNTLENEIKKIKYHQKLLLNIASHENPEEVYFFQQIISYDLDEEQVNSLLNLFSSIENILEQKNTFDSSQIDYFKSLGIHIDINLITNENIIEYLEECIQVLKINIPLKYLLHGLKKQYMFIGFCDNLLQKI